VASPGKHLLKINKNPKELIMSTRPYHALKAIGLATLLSVGTLAFATDPVTNAMQAAKPAARYDRDPAFAASVAEVAKVDTNAIAEVNANQLPQAHNTLEVALLNQDMTAIKETIGKLKGPYSKLFSKFG
jgi:hypothetical protein